MSETKTDYPDDYDYLNLDMVTGSFFLTFHMERLNNPNPVKGIDKLSILREKFSLIKVYYNDHHHDHHQ